MSPTLIVSGIVLGAVALIVAAVVMYFQRKTQEGIDRAGQPSQPGAPSAGAPSDGGEADELIRAASTRLAQSKAGAGVQVDSSNDTNLGPGPAQPLWLYAGKGAAWSFSRPLRIPLAFSNLVRSCPASGGKDRF